MMTKEELKKVLELHDAWLGNREGGSRADLYGANLYRADLSGANLYRADLSGANLYGANLYRADLYGANLYRADLSGADLSGANLSGANLSGADLSGANLSGANLSGANLSGADLSRADLSGANLSGANLSRANLSGADLSRADLSGADLSGANLYRANLYGATNAQLIWAQTEILSREGQLIGWKKCRNNVLVKLMVGKSAKRSNATGRKCRAERVKVLAVIGAEFGVSMHDATTLYRVGKIVCCDKWNEDRWTECGGGIHFFLTREEAEAYAG